MRPIDNNVALENELPRPDIEQKVTGSAKYAADRFPGKVIFAKYIRFPYGRGRVRRANLDAARAVPGVQEVEFNNDKNARYAGDILGHVVADSRNAIEDAIEALAIDFAMDAPDVEPKMFYDGVPEVDSERAMLLEQLYDSAAHVVEATYTTQVQTHTCLEPHGSLVDHRGDSLEAWTSTQAVMGCAEQFREATGLKGSKVTVHTEFMGGGFGSKFSIGAEGRLAAEVSGRFKRPCRVVLDRREEHADGGNRPGSIQYMKLAVNDRGKITGGRIHCVSTVGYTGGRGGVRNPNYYDFGEVVRTEGEIALNGGLPMAFRAPGYPQGSFAFESMLDELAAKAGMDPVEFRKVNETSDRRRRQFDWGAELIGWSDRRPDGSRPGRVKRGHGCGASSWGNSKGRCSVEIDVFRTGEVEVRVGIQDIGTGATAMVADIVADHLQLPREMVTARLGNSDYPPGPASGGSVTSRFTAPALRDAAQNAIEEVKKYAAAEFATLPRSVVYENGSFRLPSNPMTNFAWADVAKMFADDKITVQGSFNDDYWGNGSSDGVQFVTVDVDTETGIVLVRKVVAIQACGRPANRLTCENQVYGGVIQGISYALFEDRVLDGPTGGHVNPDMLFYKIAGSKDVPEIVAVLDVEEDEDGIRSLGEPTTIPTAGAIANAVANAIGVRVRDLPLTPARVLAALENGGTA